MYIKYFSVQPLLFIIVVNYVNIRVSILRETLSVLQYALHYVLVKQDKKKKSTNVLFHSWSLAVT